MTLNFKDNGLIITDVDYTCIFAGAYYNPCSLCWECAEMNLGTLV